MMLYWSSLFNQQHAVDRYSITVTPDPTGSCSSSQVMPNVNYTCSNFNPEANYTIAISAINCGSQEGEAEIIILKFRCNYNREGNTGEYSV
jgi:hypothetical protein